jgi:hypothetical protein
MQSYLFSLSPCPRTSSPALIFKNVVNYAGLPFQQPSYWMTHSYCLEAPKFRFSGPFISHICPAREIHTYRRGATYRRTAFYIEHFSIGMTICDSANSSPIPEAYYHIRNHTKCHDVHGANWYL